MLDRSKLLDGIGLADINRELEKQTGAILEKQEATMNLETGFESSISELEIKNYVDEVVTELQKIRGTKSAEK